MRGRWRLTALTLLAGLLALALIPELHAATTWRFRVTGNPGTGDIVYGRDTNSVTSLASVASGQVLVSGGAGVAPAWSASPTVTALTSPTITAATTLTGSGTGALQGFVVPVVSAASGTTALTTAQSGALVVNTGTSGTTTFTLPAAAAGLRYCFVEGGDAAGELLINVQTGDLIIGKTHGAENGTGIATTAGTGVKNTAATNVKGDFTCLVALDATSWLMTAVAGVWASQ